CHPTFLSLISVRGPDRTTQGSPLFEAEKWRGRRSLAQRITRRWLLQRLHHAHTGVIFRGIQEPGEGVRLDCPATRIEEGAGGGHRSACLAVAFSGLSSGGSKSNRREAHSFALLLLLLSSSSSPSPFGTIIPFFLFAVTSRNNYSLLLVRRHLSEQLFPSSCSPSPLGTIIP
ncbi:unnamed protein product, partial [Ectocarpus sp. 8 AP-2014]